MNFKNILVITLFSTSALVHAKKDVLNNVLSNKVAACKSDFALNSYVRLAAGSEEELSTDLVLKKRIEAFSQTGELISRNGLSLQKRECVVFAEGLLAGSLMKTMTSEISKSLENALGKAVESIYNK